MKKLKNHEIENAALRAKIEALEGMLGYLAILAGRLGIATDGQEALSAERGDILKAIKQVLAFLGGGTDG